MISDISDISETACDLFVAFRVVFRWRKALALAPSTGLSTSQAAATYHDMVPRQGMMTCGFQWMCSGDFDFDGQKLLMNRFNRVFFRFVWCFNEFQWIGPPKACRISYVFICFHMLSCHHGSILCDLWGCIRIAPGTSQFATHFGTLQSELATCSRSIADTGDA